VIRVYAFVLALERLPDRRGVAGAPLETRAYGDVSAIVSCDSCVTACRELAIAHGLVVEGLTDVAAAVLPVRFGETFADESALEFAVRERGDAVRRALLAVRGCVELGVRVEPTVREPVAAASGTEYLRARLAEVAPAEELHRLIDHFARASKGSGRADGVYLVERGSVGAMRAAASRFAETHPRVSVVCSGPWAPYSFGGGVV
jgi:hypothetical protein